MNNKLIIGGVVVAVIIGGLWYFSQKQYQPTQNQPATQQTAQEPQTTVTANTVTLQNFSFTPATLTVKEGATVTWVNEDSVTHKIRSDTFNSSDLNKGDTFDFTFTTKGSFDYSCSIHPSMTGKIIVE